MCRATLRIVRPGFVQAQLAVHCQPDIRRIAVFLAVIFPPANGAQTHRFWSLQSPVSTAGTAKKGRDRFHALMDEKTQSSDDRNAALRPKPQSPGPVLKRKSNTPTTHIPLKLTGERAIPRAKS